MSKTVRNVTLIIPEFVKEDDAEDTGSEDNLDSEQELDRLDGRMREFDAEEADFFIVNDAEPEIKQLQEWAIETRLHHDQLDKLLKILRARLLTTLPKSSKTFLGTSS